MEEIVELLEQNKLAELKENFIYKISVKISELHTKF